MSVTNQNHISSEGCQHADQTDEKMFVGKDKKRVQQSAEVASLEFIFGIQICRYFLKAH